MAKKYEGDIVGWFYRNGHRIPIRAKKSSEKSAKKRAEDMLNHRLGEGENYRRVESVGLSGKVNYKTDIRVPVYTDPDTGVTEYDTETEYNSTKLPLRAGKGKDQLRKNAKRRGATRAPRRSEGKAFGVPRQHSKSFLRESKARRHESYLYTQGAKNVQVTGSKDAFGQTQHRVEWDEPKRKKK